MNVFVIGGAYDLQKTPIEFSLVRCLHLNCHKKKIQLIMLRDEDTTVKLLTDLLGSSMVSSKKQEVQNKRESE